MKKTLKKSPKKVVSTKLKVQDSNKPIMTMITAILVFAIIFVAGKMSFNYFSQPSDIDVISQPTVPLWTETVDLSSFPIKGDLQSLSQIVIGNSLNRTLFISNQMFTQTVPMVNGNPVWAKASTWSPVNISSFPITGELQSLSQVVYDNVLRRTLVIADRMFSQTVPMVNGNPVWAQASAWNEIVDLSSLPATGKIQELSESVIGNNVNRLLMRDNRLFSMVMREGRWELGGIWYNQLDLRTLPIQGGKIQALSQVEYGGNLNRTIIMNNRMFSQKVPSINNVGHNWVLASTWQETTDLSSLPDQGSDIQSLSEYIYSNNLHRTLIRNNHMWTQTVPLSGGIPSWNQRGAWKQQTDLSSLPGGGSEIYSLSEYMLGNDLYRTILLKTNKMYSQKVPGLNWASAGSWSETVDLHTLPGRSAGSFQPLSEFVYAGNLHRILIRDNKLYFQLVPIVNGLPDWTQAGGKK